MLLTADFETTVDENDCRVWAWGVNEIGNNDFFLYGNTIESFFDFMKMSNNSTFYFHNLKFDGSFIIDYLLKHDYKHVVNKKEIKSKTFTTLISDKGQFYSIKIYFKKGNKVVTTATIYDSLKILPFSVEEVAEGFNLPISKLQIDYNAKRKIEHILTNEEVLYLKNDVQIMSMALDVLFKQGLTKMTQGSNALHDYINTISKETFERYFPILSLDVDSIIRKSYKGGYTYANPIYKNKDVGMGMVLDVNSLYPYVLENCLLPYGEPIRFNEKYEYDEKYPLYIQEFTCQFELKDKYIPTIQLKSDLRFIPTEYVTSSNYEEVTMCLTNIDFELFKKHYNIYNIVYHKGYKFQGTKVLFKPYIKKWIEVKINADKTGNKSMRTLAKLMLNALYGKFGLNPKVCSKIPYLDNGVVKYRKGVEEFRKPLYIPVATFVTAYARSITITTAQKLGDKFLYSDTDSVHFLLDVPKKMQDMNIKDVSKLTTNELIDMGVDIDKDINIHPYDLGCWKIENIFYRARFIRQKTYVEDSNKSDVWNDEKYDKSKLNITCAGMPKKCYEFVTWDNFKEGNSFKGKLMPKKVAGGTILVDESFTINIC
jgi:hypothetical protein